MSSIKHPDSPKSSSWDDVSTIAEFSGSQKVLEEEEYLDRMTQIISRDFFPRVNESDDVDRLDLNYHLGNQTPGTGRSQVSITESVRSRREACSMRLNDFLNRYTSEDNAYFEKLQNKELRRHRAKYGWLYRDKESHNESVKMQLELPSIEQQATSSSASKKMIGWPYNPKNSLFYPKSNQRSEYSPSTVNYESNKYCNDQIFKEPLPKQPDGSHILRRHNNKIGVDGKLIDGSETPVINGYSYIPERPRTKLEPDLYYLPSQSPRDELAHRLYEQRVAKSIRTPKIKTFSGDSSLRTPSTDRKDLFDMIFSPERIKTPISRR